jgi:hypothetical protein
MSDAMVAMIFGAGTTGIRRDDTHGHWRGASARRARGALLEFDHLRA